MASSGSAFRVALLGAGGIAPEHAAHLRAIPGIELAAVCDLAIDRAQKLARKYQIPRVFRSLPEMLQDCKPDVVHVLAPPTEHVKLALQCLPAGSHVFIEKPLGVSVAECRELQRVAEAASRVVGVNHNLVYRPVVQRLIGEIRACRLGRIEHVGIGMSLPPAKIRTAPGNPYMFQAPQNMLFESACHPLSVVRRLLGRLQKTESLITGWTVLASGKAYYSSWQSSLLCERGTAQLAFSVGRAFGHVWMNVLGQDGFAFVDFAQDSMILTEYSAYRPVVAGLGATLANSRRLIGGAGRNARNYFLTALGARRYPTPGDAGMRDSIASFYRALRHGQSPPEGLSEGMAVVEFCEEIFAGAFPRAAAEAR